MAGAGYKLFVNGNTLSASDLNTYVQQQTVMVFASASARTTALSGVLSEGMVSYRLDSHVLEVYNGTIWEATETVLTTKGDLVAFDTAPTRLPVGSNAQVLTADSTQATGIKWATPAAGYSAPTIGSTSIGSGATVTTIAGLTLTSPTISTITNTGTVTLPTATDTLVARTTTDTLTNKTLAGSVFQYPIEAWYINATAFAGYTAYLQTNNAVHYLTTTSTANGALNITYASGVTLNANMVTGQAISFALLITNTTAYYANSIQVDGTTSGVTTKWSGGTAPSAGNASAVDIYQFTILKTGSATFTVLAAGPIKYA
jgi:hypothetical protein